MSERTCSVDGCHRRHEARGYCNAHYLRSKNGLPLDAPIKKMRIPFWGRVDRSGGLDSCWTWTGARYGHTGYGHWWNPATSQHVSSHRHAAELALGPIPDGCVVMHACDNPPCCNPLHLSIGDHRLNARDMFGKGRGRQAGKHSGRKLTDEQVIAVFHADGTNQQVADRFAISKTTVSHIKSGRARRDALGGLL